MKNIHCDVAYVAQSEDGKIVKFGVSGNPRARVLQLSQTMPFEMKLVALVAEGRASVKAMKELLSPSKLQGEWFEPKQELNDFLSKKRVDNQLLLSCKVDDAYCQAIIKPFVLEYLNGRQPAMNDKGDLVFRFLREGYPAIAGRLDILNRGLKGFIPSRVLCGFVPLPSDHEMPAISLPETKAVAA